MWTQMQRGGPVKRETEIGVSLIHVKGCLGLLGAERRREGCPQGLQREQGPAHIFITDFWPPDPEREEISVVLSHLSCANLHTNTLFHPTPQIERDNRHILEMEKLSTYESVFLIALQN